MEKDRVTGIVAEVINAAADAKSWSLAQLTRHLGKGENTLHRWKTGATTAYDMSTIVKLFKMAGMSMDQAFAIPTADDEMAASNVERLEKLAVEVNGIKNQLNSLEPVVNLISLISDAAAGAKTYTQPRENGRRTRRAGVGRNPLKGLQADVQTFTDDAEDGEAEAGHEEKQA